MGLDVTHDCWHGAYSAFGRWRSKLAEVAGYSSYEDARGYPIPEIDWGNIEATIGKDLMGKWEKVPVRPDGTEDPLIILIAHSDCEGEIQAGMCELLANRLEELLPLLGEEDGGGHVGLYTDATQRFIKGLRLAASQNEPVEFW